MIPIELPRYFYGGPVFAVTEPDGVRIMGPDTCDLIQKVPGTFNPNGFSSI